MTKSRQRKRTLQISRLPHAAGLPLPAYQTSDAAGMDLAAAVAKDKPVVLQPGAHALVPTGLAIALPAGTEAQVRPRSGLAAKHGVTVLNSPGTIDADYRGEVSVILINHGKLPFKIERGDRIAQLVIAPVMQLDVAEVSALSATERGAGGFGSTGVAPVKSKAATSDKPRKRTGIAPNRGKAKTPSPKARKRKRSAPPRG